MHKKAKNADESNIPITQGMVLLNNLNIKRYRANVLEMALV